MFKRAPFWHGMVFFRIMSKGTRKRSKIPYYMTLRGLVSTVYEFNEVQLLSLSIRCHPEVWQRETRLRHSVFSDMQHSSSLMFSNPVSRSKVSIKVCAGLPRDNVPWEGSHVTVRWAGDVLSLNVCPASLRRLALMMSETGLRPLYTLSLVILVMPLMLHTFFSMRV